jgi:hypothetical protein
LGRVFLGHVVSCLVDSAKALFARRASHPDGIAADGEDRPQLAARRFGQSLPAQYVPSEQTNAKPIVVAVKACDRLPQLAGLWFSPRGLTGSSSQQVTPCVREQGPTSMRGRLAGLSAGQRSKLYDLLALPLSSDVERPARGAREGEKASDERSR